MSPQPRHRVSHRLLSILSVAVTLCTLAAGCTPSYEMRLRVYEERSDPQAAKLLLEQALALDPTRADLVRERAIVAFGEGRTEEALSMLDRVLASAPGDLRASLYKAMALDRLARWDQAALGYRRVEMIAPELPSVLLAGVVRQGDAVERQEIAARVERALGGTEPAPQRVLILPFDLQNPTPLTRSVRLGLVAVLIEDWRQVPATAAVSYAELQGFLAALGVDEDGSIDAPTRTRLAELTGASHVVYGRLAEAGGNMTFETRIADRISGADVRVTRMRYLHGRVGTLLDLEKTILFHAARLVDPDLTSERLEALRAFATQSPQAVQLLGQALWLTQVDRETEAREALDRALQQDPGFVPARRLHMILDAGLPPAVAGSPETLQARYEYERRTAGLAAVQSEMLLTTRDGVGLIGGPGGEGHDLSLNRPGDAGGVSVSVRIPR